MERHYSGKIRVSSFANNGAAFMQGIYAKNGNKLPELNSFTIDPRVIGDKFTISEEQSKVLTECGIKIEAVKWLICLMKKDFGDILYSLPYDCEQMGNLLKAFKPKLCLVDIEAAIDYMRSNNFISVYTTDTGIRTLLPYTRINRILVTQVKPIES